MSEHKKTGFETIRSYWPVITVIAFGLIGLGGLQYQTTAMASEIKEQEADIEANDEAIEDIQRSLIRRQGEIGLDLERLRIEQDQQGEKLDSILRLLENQPSRDRRD